MEIIYFPTYSILKNCSKEYVLHLSKELAHDISEDYLKLFSRVVSSFKGTKQYLFKASKNKEGTFDVELYSGFLSNILKDIYSGTTVINKNDLFITSTVNKYTCTNYNTSIILREHQKQIVETCLKHKRGIIKSPTSSGKSFCIAELVRVFNIDNLKILITVPTINLLDQMAKDINEYFKLNNLEEVEIGRVGDGTYKLNNITIGIPNSLCKVEKTKEYLNSVDVLICDEVHMVANPTYSLIIEHCTNRKISLGLSATIEVADGTGIFLEGFFGPTICSITEFQMIDKNIILEPKFCFYTAPKAFLPNTLAYNANNISNLSDAHRYKTLPQVYNYLIINNEGRNNIIINKAIEQINKNNGPIIIIVNKVNGPGNHADVLQSLLLRHNIDLPIISGYISKKKREIILEDLKTSKIPGVISGPKVLTAGINIPSLSCIILAGAGKAENDFIQRVGRLLRKREGKERPLVIDFIDQQYWFKNQSRSRIQTASSIYGDHNIEII